MKIGILTFHRSFNYGAFMQCFSLVNKLKEDFPNAEFEVVDYTVKRAIDNYMKEIQTQKSKKLKRLLIERNNSFTECQESLPLSKIKIVSNEYGELVEYLNQTYDAIVVGSDAVWNWICRGFPNIYFLKDYKGKKYSYAASVHGMNYQYMTGEQKEYLREALSDFSYIGVRDITTEKMVRFINGELNVQHNCDPTVLLDLNKVPCDLVKLKEKMVKKGVDFSKPLIGLMAGEKIGYEIKKKYKDNIQLIAVYQPNRYADVYLNDLTPYEWAHVFSFFKMTLTHFFHGTLLSLVNGTPVIPIEFVSNFSSMNKTKIQDVMERLGLIDWRVETDYRHRSFLKRVFMKLKWSIDWAFWAKVFEKVDTFLVEDYKEDILSRIHKERESYRSFENALREFIK